ncbi:heme biosynthesis protein HemY [Saccharospirillum mangrovi]|uniref:heme biosynthesis protein HemY n=1 Tax=Saccharospirillum mangrovi TaxID=2161747 RepID=UPI000D3380C6|nr:heme biosynthesis HemY N-terminal domain-containing protein [Saccharospirillum mangrovi]
MSRMIVRVILWFVLLLAAGVLAHFMVRHPGYVMLAWGQWMVEITLWAAVGLLVVGLLVLWLVVRLWRGVNPIHWARRYRDHRDRRAARVETERAIGAWLTGDEATALSALNKVVKAGGSERLPRLMTLIPERTHPNWSERLADFIEADPGLSLAAWALQANQLIQHGNTQALVDLVERQPELASVRFIQPPYWRALIDEGQADKALRRIEAAPGLHPDDRERWQRLAGRALVEQAYADGSASPATLKLIPRNLRQKPALVATEVRCLARHNRLTDAFDRLKKALERAPADELWALLTELPFNASDALQLGEAILVKSRQPSATAQTVLGLLSEREALWGQAENYLQAAWEQAPSVQSGQALAALYERRGDKDRALALYKQLAATVAASGDTSVG